MAKEFYYHFRRVDSPKGLLAILSVYDLSGKNLIDSASGVSLRIGGKTVATSISPEKATYPEIARSGALLPALHFEAPIRDFEENLTDVVNRIECVWNGGTLLTESAVFGLPSDNTYPVPDEENMIRVAGKIKANGFLVSGASWYAAFQELLNAELGGLDRDAPILDWGMGCGRIARFFLLDGYKNLHEIDIDQKNVDWCIDNMPEGNFSRCSFDPPSQYESGKFSAVYGHSVFTHLSEESEIAWLKEIARVLTTDGIACCTIASEFSCQMLYNTVLDKNPNYLGPLLSVGRQDFGADPWAGDLDKGREGYYRVVAHSRDYIFKRWSEHVEILRIIPGFANNQDAVVFKKKGSN